MKRASSKAAKRSIGELELIDQIRSVKQARSSAVALGIGDDCAILRPPAGSELLVTTDFSLEGRHFRRDLHPAAAVGHRCLARGLSDLAAMGATPVAAFLSLALPAELLASRKGQQWVKEFFAGLQRLADRSKTPLAGGDTAQSPAGILADIVLIGSAPRGRSLRRSTARPGDLVYCTGHLGGSAAEIEGMLARGKMARLDGGQKAHPHLLPEPRLTVGSWLMKRRLATACIDLSDGLSIDLTHLCAESDVAAEVEATALPLHPLALALGSTRGLDLALNGGEDYELLFTASPTAKMPRSIAGVPITRIGRITRRSRSSPAITLIERDDSRSPLKPGGWEHFKSSNR
jgi:thiamine-monophosphate kinase